MTIKVNCDQCEKEIHVSPSRLQNNKICCSRECASKLKEKNKIPNVECCNCKKAIYLKPSYIKKTKNVTCSYECSYALRSLNYKGEGNHQWGLKGDLNASHKSDFSLSTYGYVYVLAPNHPKRNAANKVLFHRLVMEEYLKSINDLDNLIIIEGQYIISDDLIVHHKDENKLNNLIDNLELMSLSEHTTLHNIENSANKLRNDIGRYLPGEIKEGKLYKANNLDAGQDIFSNEEVVIEPHNSKLISTNLYISIPQQHVGLIWSRSGLSVKHKIEVGAGCIDIGYTGEVKVHLYNFGNEPYTVKNGDKIAQLLTIPINLHQYKKVDEFTPIESNRAEKGFGSSGV